MRILINAVAIKAAGSKSVCINFLRALETVGKEHEYYVFLPGGVGYEIFGEKEYLHITFIPLKIVKPVFRYYIDHIYLKWQINKIRPDVIFSMGNIALPIKNLPQLLLFHIPHPAYPESIYWKRIRWSSRLHFKILVSQITKKFRYATSIAVQTNDMKDRLTSLFNVGEKLKVIPNAVSFNAFSEDNKIFIPAIDRDQNNKDYKFLCLSRYYEHKNIEVFIPLATLIKQNKLNYKIMITISGGQHKNAKKFLHRIKELRLEDIIKNIGPLKIGEISKAYHDADAMLLPTFLESFSGTYIESAYYRKPVFTSDLDFARDVCGNSAVYFNPMDPLDILDKMRLIEDNALMNDIIHKASQRLDSLPDWPMVAKMYLHEMEKISQSKH